MKWNGDSPLVVGTVDDNGVDEEIIILPGEEIPPRALELIRQARKDGLDVPYDDGYSRENVKAAYQKDKDGQH